MDLDFLRLISIGYSFCEGKITNLQDAVEQV